MHEISIAQNIIEIIQSEMGKNNAKNLKSVRVQIGVMSAVVPDCLSFCFEAITANTQFKGAELIMDIIALTGRCQRCKSEFEMENYSFKCPTCKSNQIETLSGRELSIVELEVD